MTNELDIPRMGIPEQLARRMSMAEQHEYLTARTRRTRVSTSSVSRRNVLRSGAVLAGAAVAAPTLGGLTPAAARTPDVLIKRATRHGAYVVPFARHLAFGRDPRSQMSIAWQVALPVDKPFVRIGRSPVHLADKIAAEIRPLHSAVPGAKAPVDQYYLHAELDGLHPDTTYFYGVGHKGYDPAENLASVRSFTTAPQRGSRKAPAYTFTAFGDQGVSYDAIGNDAVLLGQDPRFHLHAGDIAYADPSGQGLPESATGANGTDVYDPRVWDSFLAQTESVAATVPWMVATGNHDMEALYSPNGYGGQEARWDFPGNGPGSCPSVYSFIYGNVGYISLDANDVSYEIPANKGYSGGTQKSWLRSRLAFLRQQDDVDFVVIYFHHCAYSTTNQHASEGGVRDEWVPLFDQFKVDLVINGHNHVYERADALRAGVSKPTPIGATVHPADGTMYVTAGGAGRSLYSFPVPDTFEGHEARLDVVPTYHWDATGTKVTENVEWSRVRYTGYSFIAVDVVPAPHGHTTSLTVRAVAENGSEVDRFTIARKAGLVDAASRGVDRARSNVGAS